MEKRLAILGAGHLGQQIAHYAIDDNHYKEVFFFDDVVTVPEVNGHKVAGKISDLTAAFQNKTFDEIIIGIGYKHLQVRKDLYDQFLNKIPFGKIIHSSCWVDKTALVKDAVVIYPGCCIDALAVIDSNTILNINCSIAHDTVIGKHCFLSPRVAVAGFVQVEESCSIGINATIIDNLKIISKTRIGAGAVIIKSIEQPGLYVGNPARFVK